MRTSAVPTGLGLISHFTQGLTTPTRAKTARVGDPGTPWAMIVPPCGLVLLAGLGILIPPQFSNSSSHADTYGAGFSCFLLHRQNTKLVHTQTRTLRRWAKIFYAYGTGRCPAHPLPQTNSKLPTQSRRPADTGCSTPYSDPHRSLLSGRTRFWRHPAYDLRGGSRELVVLGF